MGIATDSLQLARRHLLDHGACLPSALNDRLARSWQRSLHAGLPPFGGRELAAFARQLRPTLPILLITGYAIGPAPAGTPDVPTLRKPFDRAALAAALAAFNPPADPESPCP